jgi:hypothetical protein
MVAHVHAFDFRAIEREKAARERASELAKVNEALRGCLDALASVPELRFTEDREFRSEELELARALASQASLAIQLTRLANGARQSANFATPPTVGSLLTT